jgi:hypothetical protein
MKDKVMRESFVKLVQEKVMREFGLDGMVGGTEEVY